MRTVVVLREHDGARTDEIDYYGYFLDFGIRAGPYGDSSTSFAIIEHMDGTVSLVPLHLMQFCKDEHGHKYA